MKLNIITVTKLLLKPELWETVKPIYFEDELILRDMTIRFYSDYGVNFKTGIDSKSLYKPNVFIWPIVCLLGRRLNKIVKKREKALRDSKSAF